jgi:hypothetical protein
MCTALSIGFIMCFLMLMVSMYLNTKWKKDLYDMTEDFEKSQDDLAEANVYLINARNSIKEKDKLLTLRFDEIEKLQKNFNALICEHPDCQNLKYYKFKYCSAHVEGSLSEIDQTERPHT